MKSNKIILFKSDSSIKLGKLHSTDKIGEKKL